MYRQVRLLARCEVGAELARFAAAPDEVHAGLAAWSPRALLATTTHDSKRSEDVRARNAVLSEVADRWAGAVRRWSSRAARLWGEVTPDRTAEYGLWQTLAGAWPLPVERVREFVLKAAREDGRRTEWRRRDAAFEAALLGVVDGIYADGELLMDIAAFAAELRPHGDRNSLAQLLVKLTAPGVPDVYQGSELRDDSLVDPDNRRAVDFADRRHKLAWVRATRPADAATARDLGCQKLWTIRRVLALRGREPERFAGAYRALVATGTHAHRVFAFARGDALVTVVPRLGVHADGWVGTRLELPAGRWRDVLSDAEHAGGAAIPLAALWASFPIALLARVG
jgi:(1->4)-alpha-D-glucan 1-alpha-D-glucosylmutase